MKATHCVAFILAVVGGINWGLVGLGGFFGGDWNLVDMLLGNWPVVANLVYVLVGLSALYLVFTHKHDCKCCDSKSMGQAPM